uniref:Uncharacterized protein n=1 Tax=Romanomermis culicivorax TaxID=13658 RepID=A0A915IZK1_ROMCU
MTHWRPQKSTTLLRQSLPPFTTSRCQMFYPPTPPIEFILPSGKSPYLRLCQTRDGAQQFSQPQSFDGYDTPKTSSCPKSAKEKKEETEGRLEQITRGL